MTLFKFNDSRLYLRHYISALPKNGRGEALKIARHLGVSTTLISQILTGEKSFTLEQAQSLVGYLGLTEIETDYLLFMVQLERAGSADLKKFWQGKLREIQDRALKISNRIKPAHNLSEQERAVFYSTPLYSAIRLFTSVGKKGKSLGEICDRFELPRAKTTEMLRFLCETGLCVLKSERYFMGTQSTHLEFGSPHLFRHHSNWRVKAISRSERLSDKELMYTAPVSLSKEDFEELREKMVVFIQDFLKTVHASPAEEVACLNLDFFWV